VPFRDAVDLRQHFIDHGADLSAATAAEYEAKAERFMNGPKKSSTLECQRKQGGRARFDQVTQEYGSVRGDGTIATYFIPNPAVHGFASNLDYYYSRC
jgi:pyocin large subunit-like protein